MSFWGGLKKAIGVAAPIAASFIPGVGPLLGAGIGAAGGALAGGKKGALLGGVTGGLGNMGGVAGMAGSAGKSGAGGFLSKLFGKGGLDPTATLLGGLSLLGGDDEQQKLQSYKGKGLSDPVTSMNDSLGAIRQLMGQLGGGVDRPAIPGLPKPLQVPGLPFQIGGGLGTDPSMFQPMKIQNPFQMDLGQAKPKPPSPSGSGARRRSPE
jgi:hypothetical protein